MKYKTTALIAAAIVAGLILLVPRASLAQDPREEIEAVIKDYLATHPDEVGEIARSYFIKHPEAVGQILAEILKNRRAANVAASIGVSPDPNAQTGGNRADAVTNNAASLFSSTHQVTLGNPHGDVTLVEFFDYNCGYCKRALPDMLTLLKDDPKLKIVLKEFPILGPGSLEAARVAVAVRMQDPGGQKYIAFHQELLGSQGPASQDKALVAAKDQGLDMARLERDMASDEVGITLKEDLQLASALAITGTPGYVIGKDVVLGAIGMTGLKRQIDAARGAETH
jgi:protein-disulfide isomerase